MAPSRSRTRSLSPYSRRAQAGKAEAKYTRNRSPRRGKSFSPTPPRRDRERSRDYRRKDRPSPSPPRRDRDRSRSPRKWPSHSASPPRREHPRSRSPRRRPDDIERPRKSGGGGFKWKEKPRRIENDRKDDRGLERGYRGQDNGKPRVRSPTREEQRRDDVGDMAGSYEDSRRKDDIDAKFGGPAPKRSAGSQGKDGEKPKKEKKEKKQPTIAPTGESPMIIVNVNDRLGTKAAIPCLASDPISMLRPHFPSC